MSELQQPGGISMEQSTHSALCRRASEKLIVKTIPSMERDFLKLCLKNSLI